MAKYETNGLTEGLSQLHRPRLPPKENEHDTIQTQEKHCSVQQLYNILS
jgi:hypothetical protein